MSAKDWMGERTVSDISTSIQSQTIQTALEANTSKITDAGFQSYLQNAPIPRGYFVPPTGVNLPTGVETIIPFTAASATFDPYAMLSATASNFVIPVSGFYTISATVAFTQVIGAGTYTTYAVLRSGISKTYATNATLSLNEITATLYAAASGISLPICVNKPFQAGDLFYLAGFQNGIAAGVTTVNADPAVALTAVWTAPYNTYTTGAGGN